MADALEQLPADEFLTSCPDIPRNLINLIGEFARRDCAIRRSGSKNFLDERRIGVG